MILPPPHYIHSVYLINARLCLSSAPCCLARHIVVCETKTPFAIECRPSAPNLESPQEDCGTSARVPGYRLSAGDRIWHVKDVQPTTSTFKSVCTLAAHFFDVWLVLTTYLHDISLLSSLRMRTRQPSICPFIHSSLHRRSDTRCSPSDQL